MFIGHMPAAYLGITALRRPFSKPVMAAALIGSVFPDIDMIWFYFIDHGAIHHHHYLTHRPILYVIALAIAWILPRKLGYAPMAFCLAVILHVALDSVAGSIAWGWPFSDVARPLTVVEATHDHWIKSFMHHWYFKLELVLTAVAITVAIKRNFWTEKT